MKNYLYLAMSIALIVVIAMQCQRMKNLQESISMHERNEHSWMAERQSFKVNDSLNAMKALDLELRLNDALKVVGEDRETIKQLTDKINDMTKIDKVSTKTEIKVVERLKDTTIHDTIAKYIEVEKPFYDVKAVILHDTISLDVTHRDSLLIVEEVKHKRFLGFLWKTSKIKERKIDVVSKNPNTIIEDVKFVTIRK